jgi:hypothetical protein
MDFRYGYLNGVTAHKLDVAVCGQGKGADPSDPEQFMLLQQVKTASDYALMHLDKGNYKLILAEFETRTGVKVEAEGENK